LRLGVPPAASARPWLVRRDRDEEDCYKKYRLWQAPCEAFEEGERGGYRFTGQGSYSSLLPGKLSTLVVTPAGFEPAISTLKGSRPGPG
jgi:hypothetical protein